MRFLARGFNDQGNAASRAGNIPEAERLWKQAVTVDPKFSAAWFNLGLMAKKRGEWSECLRCNRAAVQADPKNTGAWWNLGIAATALRRWPEARQAWAAHKIPIPAGNDEPRAEYGLVPIRVVSSGGMTEVLWGDMIDPARVRIRNVPRPRSQYRFGDVVLRDGAPDGERELEGRKLPIFNVLGVYEASTFGTFAAVLRVGSGVRENLLPALQAEGWGFEDWSTTRAVVAEGSGAPAADPDLVPPPEGCVRWVFAAPAEAALRDWLHRMQGVELVSVETVVPPR
jgi:hypothetical protein